MIKTLLRDEKGIAMTEFLITLPIFITIFIGMGSIYNLHNQGLEAMGEANRLVWEEAQTIPITAASPLQNIANFGTMTDLLVNGSNGLGIYKDSYAKTLPTVIIPGAPGVSPREFQLEKIGGFGTKAHSKFLLDDFYSVQGVQNANSVTTWALAAVQLLGVSLGMGAGIRYGAGDGVPQPRTVNTFYGSFTVDPGKLSLPYNTAATHRGIAVAQTRLQHSTDDVFNESILNFDWDLETGGMPDIGQISGASAAVPPALGSCGAQAQTYGNCISGQLQSGVKAKNAKKACQSVEPSQNCQDMSGSNISAPSASNCAQFKIPASLCKFD